MASLQRFLERMQLFCESQVKHYGTCLPISPGRTLGCSYVPTRNPAQLGTFPWKRLSASASNSQRTLDVCQSLEGLDGSDSYCTYLLDVVAEETSSFTWTCSPTCTAIIRFESFRLTLSSTGSGATLAIRRHGDSGSRPPLMDKWLASWEDLPARHGLGLGRGSGSQIHREAELDLVSSEPLQKHGEWQALLSLRELEQIKIGNMGFQLVAMAALAGTGGTAVLEHPAAPPQPTAASIWRTPIMQMLLLPECSFCTLAQGLWGAQTANPTSLAILNAPGLLYVSCTKAGLQRKCQRACPSARSSQVNGPPPS